MKINQNSCYRLFQLFCALTFILLWTGCSVFYSKDDYIDDFSLFVKDVKENCSSFSENDWADTDVQYKKYAIEQYEKFKSELTPEEKLKISKLKSTYVALKVKKGASEFFDQAKEIINQAKEVFDSTINTINK